MNNLVTQAIVLRRINFGEADRILTMMTSDHGKVRVMARGVRRAKSKLAGGIELFSVGDIVIAKGRGDFYTLISARLKHNFAKIITGVDRVTMAYDFIKLIDKNTEDQCSGEYFKLLRMSLMSLNNEQLNMKLVRAWLYLQILSISGLSPNLKSDLAGQRLELNTKYSFDFEQGGFSISGPGSYYGTDEIKLLRLLAKASTPDILTRVAGIDSLTLKLEPMLESMIRHNFQV